ncbi:sugar ABC transporter permease [Mycoplasma capricolum]|uniref:sugar ABC transporter permease n=1 Tax=Mycoplasma capricolum TaxID=2095 RepID=UPI000630698A|nr:sugar ABC transporter permease [Mycoplasma capricolum]KKW61763.1 Maltose/maltodextrin ABC transporter, permease protein MalG [Mycoplasma capricolum subsp. capricolum]
MKTSIKFESNQLNKKTLEFQNLLKPVVKYDFSDFKKSKYLNAIKSEILNDQTLKQTNKLKSYLKIIENNYIFGNIADLYFKLSNDKEQTNKLLFLLLANSFSTFDDNLGIEISIFNQEIFDIIDPKIDKDFLNKIKKYSEQKSIINFKELEFKNFDSYEFIQQWKNINAIIILFFKKIKYEKLGKLLANNFLLSYESNKELKDYTSASLVTHENLNENYIINKQNYLLEQIFNELQKHELEDKFIKEAITSLLTIIPDYQINSNKKSLYKKIFQKKSSQEKFRLFCSEEINNTIAKELRFLTNPSMLEDLKEKVGKTNKKFLNNNAVRINNKIIKINLVGLKTAKTIFKTKDLIDFQASLSEAYFKSKHLRFNKYYKYLTIIKLASLAYLYPLTKKEEVIKFEQSKKIFEIIIKKIGYEISKELGNKLSNLIDNDYKVQDDFLSKIGFDKLDRFSNCSKYVLITQEIYKVLGLNIKIAKYSVIYEIFKKEIYAHESNKRSNSVIDVNNISFNDISKNQNDLIFKIENELKNEKSNIYIKYIRFLTETFGKLYLSDKPPLSTSGKIGLAFTYIVLIFWVLIIIMPIFQLILQSFNFWSSNASTAVGGEDWGNNARFNFSQFSFSFANFVYLFEKTEYKNWLINSIVIAILTMIFMVIITAFIGYAFSRFRFKGKRIGLMSVMLIQMIPTISSFVAFYVLYQILDNKFGFPPLAMLLLIYVGGGIPGNVFVLKGYMDNISTDIDDAARIDGCGNWTTFIKIITPLSKPMLSVIALWSFIGPFGDILLPRLLSGDSTQYTMATGLQTLIQDPKNTSQGAFAAGSLIIALPISILFMSLQKNITGGLSAAGVKG